MIEIRNDRLRADPSNGSHFFHNITANAIPYLTITEDGSDRIDWQTLQALPAAASNAHLTHVRLPQPLILKCDGRRSRAAVLLEEAAIR
jgi:hypothetical protein